MENIVDSDSVLLVTDRVQRRYLSGIDIAEGYLIVGKAWAYFVDARYYGALKDKLSATRIEPLLFKDYSDIGEYLKGINPKKLLIDYSLTSVSDYKRLKKFGIKISDGKKIIDEKRAVKTPSEIELIKTACDIVQTAYYETLSHIKTGITELDVAEILGNKMKELGASGCSFETIVAFGKNTAVPHHETGSTVLKENEPILIDAGAIFGGYVSDFTRTVFYGVPDEKFITRYNAVFNANEIAEKDINAKCRTDVADGYAREYFKKLGLDEFFTHSLGHGVGCEIHEYPYLSPRKKDVLNVGSVFTIEPGLYFDGEYGIRIEDTVLLTAQGVQNLYTDSKELLILSKEKENEKRRI